MKDDYKVNVAATDAPEAILTTSSGNDRDLAIQRRIIISLKKSVSNSLNNLVSYLKIPPRKHLLMVNFSNLLFSLIQDELSLLRIKSIQPEEHVCSSRLFVFLDLFALGFLFETFRFSRNPYLPSQFTLLIQHFTLLIE